MVQNVEKNRRSEPSPTVSFRGEKKSQMERKGGRCRNSREKQLLNRHCQPSMQHHHHNQQHPASLLIRRANHRPQIPHQEHPTNSKPHRDENPIQHLDRTPANEGHGHPNQIRISIQRPALQHTRALAAKPLQDPPQRNRDEGRISID